MNLHTGLQNKAFHISTQHELLLLTVLNFEMSSTLWTNISEALLEETSIDE